MYMYMHTYKSTFQELINCMLWCAVSTAQVQGGAGAEGEGGEPREGESDGAASARRPS